MTRVFPSTLMHIMAGQFLARVFLKQKWIWKLIMLSTHSFLDISRIGPLTSQPYFFINGNPGTPRTHARYRNTWTSRTRVPDHFYFDKSHRGISYLARFRRITAKLHTTNLHGHDKQKYNFNEKIIKFEAKKSKSAEEIEVTPRSYVWSEDMMMIIYRWTVQIGSHLWE